jgi:hypothetical protein
MLVEFAAQGPGAHGERIEVQVVVHVFLPCFKARDAKKPAWSLQTKRALVKR